MAISPPAWRPQRRAARPVLAVGAICAAAALGALYPFAAYLVHPLALPAVLAFAALGVITLSRPEIGIAVALVLAALNPGLVLVPATLNRDLPNVRLWFVTAGWTAFLLLLTPPRRPVREGQESDAPLGLLVMSFFALTVAALAWSPAAREALPTLRSTAIGIALFFVIATQVRSRDQLGWVLAGVTVGLLLVGGYATWQYLTGVTSSVGFVTSSGELVGRVTADFSHPNQLGGFLVVLVPAGLAAVALSRRHRALCMVAVVLGTVGIYASFSRSALLGLAVVPLAFLRWRHVLVALPLLVCGTLLIAPGLVRERFGTLANDGSELAQRSDFWRAAGSIWAERPVLGAGLGSFPSAYSTARLPGKQFLPSTIFEPPPHAHNVFLHLLAEQGILGMLVFLGVVAMALRHTLQLRGTPEPWIRLVASALLGSLAAFLLHNQFDVTLSERTAIYFWALLGLVSALHRISTEERPTAVE